MRVFARCCVSWVGLLLTACAIPAPHPSERPTRVDASTPIASATTAGGATIPAGCAFAVARDRATALIAAVNALDAAAIVAEFSDRQVFWDVAGRQLRTADDVLELVAALRSTGERWRMGDVHPPTGAAGLPRTTVYDVSLTIRDADGTRSAGIKLVLDCGAGTIYRAAGPEAMTRSAGPARPAQG